MEEEASPRPSNDSWVVAVHAARNDGKSLGSGFVIDSNRVLTCAHVVREQVERERKSMGRLP
ncbi:trypsin-like serine protease [Streptomyces sp. GTA36]